MTSSPAPPKPGDPAITRHVVRSSLAARLAIGLLALACVLTAASLRPVAQSAGEPLVRSLPAARPDPRLDWWREARFGVFIHRGLYAIPAGEWNGRTDDGEWVCDNAKIPIEVRDRLQAQSDPTKLGPDAWVRMAKQRLYLHVGDRPRDGVRVVPGLLNDVRRARPPAGPASGRRLNRTLERRNPPAEVIPLDRTR